MSKLHTVQHYLWIGIFCTSIGLSACSTTPNPDPLPTLAILPSETATPPITETLTPTVEPTIEALLETETSTIEPLTTEPTMTFTFAPIIVLETGEPTVVPSATITDTITPSPMPTLTPTLDAGLYSGLLDLASRVTILPPEIRYGTATLTAFAVLREATQAAQIPVVNIPPTVDMGIVGVGTPIPPISNIPITCPSQPPAGIVALWGADVTLSNQLGCVSGTSESLSGAVQIFEHGSMYYVAPSFVNGTQASIYVLYADGRFQRFDDTFIEGVDSESGGEIPPGNFVEPIRGFGKVWRLNPDVRNQLGWGFAPESGDTFVVQNFQQGRAFFSATRNQTILLITHSGGQSGTWRTYVGGF